MDLLERNVEKHDFVGTNLFLAKKFGSMKIGIVGNCRIGRITGELFAGSVLKFLCFDLYPNDECAQFNEIHPDTSEEISERSRLDFYSQCLPTKMTISTCSTKELFAQMKDGAILSKGAHSGLEGQLLKLR